MSAWKPMALAGLSAGLLVALTPAPRARAGNTVHPRTPVLWPEAPCIQTVERSIDPMFAFGYEIPNEDTLLSSDELDDSRRHQFIALCRQWPAGRPPPRYVSLFDLQRSIEEGFEDPEQLEDPESTLETSEVWAGCWARVTPDDARRPITNAAASEAVEWDSLGVVAGTWLIAGYTWEPPYNLWSRAPWVVRVIDEVDPPVPSQAAVSITNTADTLHGDEILELPVCVDAAPGSTLTLEWAPSKPEELAWSTIEGSEISLLDGPGELSIPFSPPEDSWGLSLVLRIALEQPEGAAYHGHALDTVIVFAEQDDGDGDGDDTDASTGADETDGTDGAGGADSTPTGGCSILSSPGQQPWSPVLLILAVWPFWPPRRRQRAESCSFRSPA